MAEIDIPDTLKTTFHERCLAATNRGLGMVSLSESVTYEIRVNDELCPASFFRGDQIADQTGKRVILWSGLILGSDNKIFKSTESEPIDMPDRPTLASEEVMGRYMIEDLRALFVPDLGESILLEYLRSQNEAEKLGLLDVTSSDVQDAITTMDELISAYDAAQ